MAGDVTTRSTIDGIAPRPPDAAELTRRYGATLRAMLVRALGDEARAERALPGLLHELARRAARPPAGVPLDDLVYGHARRWIAELANVPAVRPAPPIEAPPGMSAVEAPPPAPAADPPPSAASPPPPPRELRVQIPTQRLPEEPEPKPRGRFLLWLLAGLLLMAVTALATRFGLEQWGLLPDALRTAPPPAATATAPETAPPLPDTAPPPPPTAATIEPPPPPEAPAPAAPAPLAEPPQAEAPTQPPPPAAIPEPSQDEAPAAAAPPPAPPAEPAAAAPPQPSPPPAITPPWPRAAPPPPSPAALPEPPQDEAPASAAPPPAPPPEPAVEAPAPLAPPPAPAVEPAAPPAAEPPPAVSPNVRLGPPGTPRVYLHYTSDDANGAAIAEALAARIREQGITVAGIRPVPFVIGSGSVRYYYDADAALARNLADICNAEADPPLCARGALDFQSFTPPPLAGTVEVWIADRQGR
ncbi:MAG: hypothetical protein U1E45_10280 [Geminicoccaceae bacterium]